MRSLMPEQDWAVSDYYHYYMSVIRTEGLLPPAKSESQPSIHANFYLTLASFLQI